MFTSSVEKSFFKSASYLKKYARIPFITVTNFPDLGLLTALRFLEWVSENPEGVICLPTGKTPDYFIKWVQRILLKWDNKEIQLIRNENGLNVQKKPNLKGLKFVQIDEFYPINPDQHNSFFNYVMNYYIDGFGLDQDRACLINCNEIPRDTDASLNEIFPNYHVDLTLRFKDPESKLEELQQRTIHLVDQWCSEYEDTIRNMGGIGFFIGGIGPDGHIAFNIRGSDHHSATRLMETNFETQAAAAVDLGGIEISRDRLVITIGLETIISNKDAVAIILAAGEAKSKIVQDAVESEPDINYPASALQKLVNARFYLTEGAACQLKDVMMPSLKTSEWNQEKTERVVINLCYSVNKFGARLTLDDFNNDSNGSLIPELNDNTAKSVIDSLEKKINSGLENRENESFLHTGPHHDDITTGYLPFIAHLVRSPRNRHHFCTLTSGFTAVTNKYVIDVLKKTEQLFDDGLIQMIEYPNFFVDGYQHKWDKDVYHYLDRMAANNLEGRQRGLSHRIVRCLIEIYDIKSKDELRRKLDEVTEYLSSCYNGEKNTPEVQRLKGMIREFEEDLVWSHYGVQTKDISHLRLGFYQGDIFSEDPEPQRDVLPILVKLREIEPTIITLALDPEGSGPDTHYKVLQAIAEAVRMWGKETDLTQLKIWGYRNVWTRFDAAEANIIVPVSLNSMAALRDTFLTCYLSQKNASFPSYELDGPFCDLVQQIWVEQIQTLQLVLGRDFWYQNNHPRLRAAHGALYLKELTVDEFLAEARRLEVSIEGQFNSF